LRPIDESVGVSDPTLVAGEGASRRRFRAHAASVDLGEAMASRWCCSGEFIGASLAGEPIGV